MNCLILILKRYIDAVTTHSGSEFQTFTVHGTKEYLNVLVRANGCCCSKLISSCCEAGGGAWGQATVWVHAQAI